MISKESKLVNPKRKLSKAKRLKAIEGLVELQTSVQQPNESRFPSIQMTTNTRRNFNIRESFLREVRNAFHVN